MQQSVLIVDGLPDAAEAAAAEIRQTIAVGRVSEGLAPPDSARLSWCELTLPSIWLPRTLLFACAPDEIDQ